MTFTVKVRGGAGLLMAEYMCPKHGRFELLVERDAKGDPPASVGCRVFDEADEYIVTDEDDPDFNVCGRASPWTISCGAVHTQFVITASHGKPDPKPHPRAMDTRMLAEGRRSEFRKQRRKIREEERHARLKRFLS